MEPLLFRRSFALFHATLSLVVLLQSLSAVRRAMAHQPHGDTNLHLIVLAGAEALAAILFLLPKTLDIGGTALLVIFGIALLIHGIHGQLALFVYAAGVLLVMAHGSSFSRDLFVFKKGPD